MRPTTIASTPNRRIGTDRPLGAAAAAGIAAALGDLRDTAVILAILVLNGLLGFVQEYRAERTMAALKAMTAPMVHVRRGGGTQDLPAPRPSWCPATWCSDRATCSPPTCA
jgi:hypothetical protein